MINLRCIYIHISEQGGDPAAYSIPAHEPNRGPGGDRCFVSLCSVVPSNSCRTPQNDPQFTQNTAKRPPKTFKLKSKLPQNRRLTASILTLKPKHSPTCTLTRSHTHTPTHPLTHMNISLSIVCSLGPMTRCHLLDSR